MKMAILQVEDVFVVAWWHVEKQMAAITASER
jgi:hypothetical protein